MYTYVYMYKYKYVYPNPNSNPLPRFLLSSYTPSMHMHHIWSAYCILLLLIVNTSSPM